MYSFTARAHPVVWSVDLWPVPKVCVFSKVVPICQWWWCFLDLKFDKGDAGIHSLDLK